jgi:hypothetical protein
MRTENPTSPASALDQLRAQAARIRRRVLGPGSGPRWAFVTLGLLVAAVVMLGYLAAPASSVGVALQGGRRFSIDDQRTITRALDARKVGWRIVDRRIEVAADQLGDAAEVVAKLAIGPRPIQEIRAEARQPSWWGGPAVDEKRELHGHEQILETMIRNLPGIVDAYVAIIRPRGRIGLRPPTGAKAFVWLQTEEDRQLGFKTVQAIQDALTGYEPEVRRDAVTLVDHKFHHYLDAGDPALGTKTRDRARAEELSEEILDQIDWIKGVRVSVRLVPPPPPALGPVALAPAPAAAAPVEPEPRIEANHPMALNPEPKPAAAEPAPGPTRRAAASEPPRPPGGGHRGTIWVRVPRSYYEHQAPSNPAPARADLRSFQARTEDWIRKAVRQATPPGAAFEVIIDTIPDRAAPSGPVLAPVAAPPPHGASWWVPAGTLAAVALAALVRALAARRPAVHRGPAADRGRFAREAAAEPGPSERVRELIRLNPEAAASVLQRWIGQEGHVG